MRPLATICLHIYGKEQLRSKWAFPPAWLWEGKSKKPCSHKGPSGTKNKRPLWRITSTAPWRSKSTTMHMSFPLPTGPWVGWDESFPRVWDAKRPRLGSPRGSSGTPWLLGDTRMQMRWHRGFWKCYVWELTQTSVLTAESPYLSFTVERSQPDWKSKFWRPSATT